MNDAARSTPRLRRRRQLVRALCAAWLAFGSAPLAASAQDAPPPARRALWVLCEGSQRVLEHPERRALLLSDASALEITDLFVQVYRGGRAWYDASLADATPYQGMLAAQGEDPLRALIREAHAKGLRVHAWVNTLNLSSNASAPILTTLGPSAAMVDQKGRSVLDYPGYEIPPPDREWVRMGTPGVWLDPGVPGVTEYLASTFAELLERYPELDGLHLDYVRYADALPFTPGTRFGVGLGFGFGPESRARFRQETGLEAPFGTSLVNANRFDTWRRAQTTALVAAIASRARAARPGVEVSAAVIADRERAYLVDLQDWLGWLDAGHLDFAVPMLYTIDPARWRYALEAYVGLASTRSLWVGMGAWLHATKPERGAAQLARLLAEKRLGSALFSWDSIREMPELMSALATEAARSVQPAALPAPDPPVPASAPASAREPSSAASLPAAGASSSASPPATGPSSSASP